MNKSKFLKKSLAMVLAVMLVVAMIPLGASAAAPTLSYVNVNGTAAEFSNNVYEAKITTAAVDVAVATETTGGATVVATQKDELTTDVIYDAGNALGGGAKTGPQTLTLANYNETSGVITIPLTVTATDGAETNYTLKLTRSANAETAELASAVSSNPKNDGILSVKFNNTTKIVDVAVAYGASSYGITVTTKDNATVNSTGNTSETLAGIGDGDTFIVKSQAGINTTWTIKVTESAPLTSFTVAGKAGKFTDEDDDGYAETITVTLDKDDLKDKYGDVEKNPTREITFTTLSNTTVAVHSGAALTNGGKLTLTGLAEGADFTADLDVTCNGVTYGDYDLVVTVTPSKDKEIIYAQIDNEIATVSGNKITAELVATTPTNNLNATLRVSKGATLSGDLTWTTGTSTAAYDEYTTTGADLSKPKAVVITAKDGSTATYFMSATNATTAEEAKLTAFSLKNGDKEYKGAINGSTITVTVPFMTTTMQSWKVFATPNTSAKVYNGNNSTPAPILSGETTVATVDYVGTVLDAMPNGTTKEIENAIIVRNKVNGGDLEKDTATYKLVVKFENSVIGKTLTSNFVTTASDVANDRDMLRAMDTSNTLKAKVDASKKEIQINVPHSLDGKPIYVTEFGTAKGGVAFKNAAGSSAKVAAASSTNSTDHTGTTTLADGDKIVVLPEAKAKAYVVSGDPISAADIRTGTEYTVVVNVQDPSTEAYLKGITVGDKKLNVSQANPRITGQLPYSATTAAGTTTVANFIDFNISNFAKLGNTGFIFQKEGIDPATGEVAAVSATNAQIIFERAADHKVKVYLWDGATKSAEITAAAPLTVTAEDGVAAHANTYHFDLTYADANTGAAITSFKLANTNATIKGQEISVTLPYGAKLNGLVPTFTASAGASVTSGGATITSGKTPMDFSEDVNLMVTAEDGSKTVTYTVKVTTADQFSDVPTSAWYYKYVMEAASAGIVKGIGDGKFAPTRNVTRRDFAIMLVNMLGVDTSAYTTSPFTDVKDTDYGVAAIAYCYDKEIIKGYTDGTYKPDRFISRQEAAVVVATALNINGTPTTAFKDAAQISTWAKASVDACAAVGIFSGNDKGNFNPKKNITRAEAAKVMVDSIGK